MRSRLRRGSVGTAAGVSLALLLAACGGSSTSGAGASNAATQGASSGATGGSETIAQLKPAALKEGQVTWYTTFSSDDVAPMVKAFNKDYPNIKVNPLRLSADKIPPRILTEQKAGQNKADVVSGDSTQVFQLVHAGALAPFSPPDEAPLPSDLNMPKGYQGVVYMNTTVPAWNPQTLQRLGLQPPKTWTDFTNPKWKGHFSVDPEAVNLYQSWIAQMGHDKAKQLITAIGNNNPKLVTSHTLALTQVEGGEPAATVTAYGYKAASEKKKNPGKIEFANTTPLPTHLTLIDLVKNAPHPNAGKLFIDWMESTDGQTAVEDITNHTSLRDDVNNDKTVWDPSKWQPVWADPTITPDKYNQLAQEWRQALHATG